MATKKKKTKAKAPKTKPMTRDEIATKAKAAIDDAFAAAAAGRKSKKPEFPHAAELSTAVWHLRGVVNKAVQKVYDQVLSQTIIKLQHARRKNIV